MTDPPASVGPPRVFSEETADLRHCIRDLVALSTLPAAWSDSDPERIADSVATALVAMLDVDFVYVALHGGQDTQTVEVTRTHPLAFPDGGREGGGADPLLVVRRAMAEGLRDLAIGQTVEVPHPSGAGSFRICSAPAGFNGNALLVAASLRPGFPSEVQRLLLGSAASQAALAMHRWQAETEARRFARLVESSSDFIGLATLNGVSRYINPEGLRLVGLDGQEDLPGRHILDFITPEDRGRMWDEIWPAVLRTGRWVGEIRFRHLKTGATVPFLADCFRIDEARNGRSMDVAMVSRDLTAQKRAQEALRRSEERANQQLAQLQAIYDSAPVGLAVLTTDLRFSRVNERLAALNGIPAADHVGRTVTELLPNFAEFCSGLCNRIVETGEPVLNLELTGETPAQPGVERAWNESWLPLKDEDGRITSINVVAEEITERKRAEAELRRYAAIVESSNDAIIGTTLDGTITNWNPAAEMIFGYRSDEVLGQPLTLLAAEEHEDEMPVIRRRIRQGERIEHFETMRRSKSGNEVAVSLTISPIHDAGGAIIGVSKIARDITERQRTEATLRHLNETLEQRVANRTAELKESNAKLRLEMAERVRADARLQEMQSELFHAARLSAVGQMAAALAHELNQPLAAGANFIRAVRRRIDNEGIGDDMIREDLDDAAAQVLRAGQIIRRLRDFVTRGETERRTERVREMVEEAGALVLTGAGALGVRVGYRLNPRAEKVFVNRVQVQQVIVNLIRNALEATAGLGRRELAISTDLLDAETVEIEIGDNGPGMAENVRDHLFEPFVSTRRDGMGLGLSICRSIVEAHGGRIRCEHKPGGGTVFRFTLIAVTGGNESDAT